MKSYLTRHLTCALLIGGSALSSPLYAQSLTEAITGGKVAGNFRLRYEGVEQDNVVQDADALTLRSMLNYTTGTFEGFSATLEMENVRTVLGVTDYTVGPTGFNPGLYSVIADPETTEVNQGYLQYSNSGFTAKLGRQVINLDNQRFVGAVGWRQDWQVYDALSAKYTVNDKLNLSYYYLDTRERIFAQDADLDSSDHLFHASYKLPSATLTGYAYLLELDDLPVSNSLDTYGIRLNGTAKVGEMNASYIAEFATQESKTGATSFDADYLMLEGGLTFSPVTAKLGYEVLGSDGGSYGFSTPLATLHAFNGWADLFLGTPAQGIEDIYLNLSGKVLGGTLTAVYHEFDAEDSTPGISDLGSEIDIQYVKPLSKNYTVGLKFADYSQGDLPLPDTQKLWLWFQASF